MLVVGALDEEASDDKTVIQNALAVLDLRLERWLDVVVPMPAAFRKMTYIDFDAEGRLCSFCIATREPTAMKMFRLGLLISINKASKGISVVTWRGPIGYVNMRCLLRVNGAH